MENCSDDELLYLMRMGNQDATDCFYTKYYKEVRRWVKGYAKTGHLSVDVEDCIQESMMNFSIIIDSYRDDKSSSIKTFMKNAINNRVVNYLKAGKDRRIIQEYTIISLDQGMSDYDSLRYEETVEDPSINYKPRERMIIKEECASYSSNIKKVTSPMELEIMKMVIKGFSVKEIAEIKKISSKSIYNAIYRYSKKMNH